MVLATTSLASPAFWWGVAVGLSVALIVATTWAVRSRRQARVDQARAEARSLPTAVDATPVRRPLYLDRGLLNDLLAHAEPRDFGKGLRSTLADDDLHGTAGDTRLLNKVIAGLRRQRHLIDLELDPDAPLAAQRVVLLTGRAAEHAVMADLMRLRGEAPNGNGHTTNGHGANGRGSPTAVGTRERERTRRRSEPLVLGLTTVGTERTYVGAIDTRRLRNEGRAWLTTPVTVLAVVDEVLATDQRTGLDLVLQGHVSPEIAASLGEVTGPGALLSIAAIFR